MTRPVVSPRRSSARVRRHSADFASRERRKQLLPRRSRTRFLSHNSIEEDQYFSEPDLLERSSSSPLSSFPLRASSLVHSVSSVTGSPRTSELRLAPVQVKSSDASDDEDGQLFKTLTSDAFVEASAGDEKLDDRASPELQKLNQLPPSHLCDYARLPLVVEFVLGHGILVCVSGLLYELTFMPLNGLRGAYRWVFGGKQMSLTEKSDWLRTLILFVAVWIFNASIDFSAVYHYIRAQSLLKLYFIFNMMEIIERLVRSWGNDLVDGLVRAAADDSGSIFSVGMHWAIVLVYTLLHAYIHFWRVMIIAVAMLANDLLIVLVTNNFNELKGTVFKKSEPRSLYPIVASDIVERTYLFLDVALVLFRMATSPQRSKMPFTEVSLWIGVMIGLEIVTDWMKFMCISKFNQIDNNTYWHYNKIHRDDVLNSRTEDPNVVPPLVMKGYMSASHLPGRRMNFMPTPLAILILCSVMLPNLVGADPIALWTFRLLVVSGFFIAKVAVDWLLIGDSVRSDRSQPLPEKLQNIRAL